MVGSRWKYWGFSAKQQRLLMILMCGTEERIHHNYKKQPPKTRHGIPSYEHLESTTIKAVLSLAMYIFFNQEYITD